MAKRILISVVPTDFISDPFDEIALGYQAYLISEQMMTDGILPHSALDVFKQIQGGTARTTRRPCHLILGEVVSKRQYVLWKQSIQYIRPGIWLKLLIDNVQSQDISNGGKLMRHTLLLQEICRDITYWGLCNKSSNGGAIRYRPELRQIHGGVK